MKLNILIHQIAYKEFDKMFSQVYPNFYKNLNSKRINYLRQISG